MNKNISNILDCLNESSTAIKNNDISKLVLLKDKFDKLFNVFINENKEDTKTLSENTCFGVIHKIFEHNAPILFKTKNGKKIIKEYIKTIKNDKILKEEFSFYSQLLSCNNKEIKSTIIDEALKMKSDFNKNKIFESNNKLIKLINENKLNLDVEITDDLLNVLNSISCLYETKKNIHNLSKIVESKQTICNYENNDLTNNKDNNININELSESLLNINNKLNQELTESEKDVIKTICNSTNDNEKKELFNECQNNLIENIDLLMKESSINDDVKSKLIVLKEKISNKTFNSETMLNDMIEFFDISNILE